MNNELGRRRIVLLAGATLHRFYLHPTPHRPSLADQGTMDYTVLCLCVWFFCLLSGAGSLSISFPPSGTPTAAFDSQLVTWKRDKDDPRAQFFLQKIKLDEPGGPTAKSTPIPISNSQNDEGTSPMEFNRAGLFEILAVNVQNGRPFYTTEIHVVPNPTSTGGPPPPTISSMFWTTEVTVVQNSTSTGSPSPATVSSMSTSQAPNMQISATLTAPSPTSAVTLSSDSPTPSDPILKEDSRQEDHTALIVGAAVSGGLGLLVLVGIILLCLRRQRFIARIQIRIRHNQQSATGFISPFALGQPISLLEKSYQSRVISWQVNLPGTQSEVNGIS
ncbi:hypothetical protein GYMLUDRAFT_244595 [Collybiopsis luxurians FD-317 M1]|uniref:Uncharacterized protein n=1 Tax=Collybiopsis luxurians FD-317 M1 TaxID=944289 RepID=A0A0D0BWY2_9AGAR|nr:hypothetical protein GYMLUDRAFT_244595 [Collybiopsis luxurians FD-317 M1]